MAASASGRVKDVEDDELLCGRLFDFCWASSGERERLRASAGIRSGAVAGGGDDDDDDGGDDGGEQGKPGACTAVGA